MGEWFDKQKQVGSNIRKLLLKQIDSKNPRRKLTAEEIKRLNKLEAIAEKLKRGKNVQSSVGVTNYLHTNYWQAFNARY